MLQAAVRDFFLQQGTLSATYWIAYSGGLDSHVLLALCHAVQKQYPVKLGVIHVNHQLNPKANQWALHCREVAASYGLPLIERTISLDDLNGESLEALARERRYAALAGCMQAGDYLLTAHQQDDQAETVLLQLLRGAGPRGMAAMPICKPFSLGWQARPLLAFTRAELAAYAKSNQLVWIEDDSNQDTQFTRNYMRHRVLPILLQRFPEAKQALTRSAMHAAESEALLQEYALTLLKNITGSVEGTLSVSRLLTHSSAQIRLLLRTWMQQRGVTMPDTKKLDIIYQEVLLASENAMPCVAFGEHEVRRYRGELYLLPRQRNITPLPTLAWNLTEPLTVPGRGVLLGQPSLGRGLSPALASVSVRLRTGGEVLRLPGRGTQTLKNLFQEWGVPPWQRAQQLLLFVGEECVGVVGFCVALGYVAKDDEMGYWPHLERE